MNKKLIPFIPYLFLGGLILGALFFSRSIKALHASPLPILGNVPSFQLVDTNHKEFSKRNLEGKVWIANFMFTTCAGICPMMSQNIASIQNALGKEEDIRLVSISVNPEQDTPEAMKTYAKKYNADPSKWYFLTGDREEITKLAVGGFKVGSIDEPIFHSGKLILVDKKFQIRGYFDGTDPEEIKKLKMAIRSL